MINDGFMGVSFPENRPDSVSSMTTTDGGGIYSISAARLFDGAGGVRFAYPGSLR
jgi:hypothetical protein